MELLPTELAVQRAGVRGAEARERVLVAPYARVEDGVILFRRGVQGPLATSRARTPLSDELLEYL